MGNWYSIEHIAEGCIHTDITCNTEEPQQKYRLGTVSIRLIPWGLNMFYWTQYIAISFCSGSTHLIRMKIF